MTQVSKTMFQEFFQFRDCILLIVMGQKISESSNIYKFLSKILRNEAIVAKFIN